ncbi:MULTISPECIES: response regulator [Chryseobacterium]|uniref:DNA-binding NarL/FixJ family response regulator n=1 Tax=Chryseobacterium camelliae TaxID=1265445 RepID=A0ABU0TMM7_9FLAO|nr:MULTISPECIES: response regulator [Chryseobacterium]MDT3407842.1 DNA-binding NarL/FixJ family response regulator [Pseudacidovorax intermedius]MDQ1098303.1 DNA-binding NarL/FixJ family response regulator [Chryseobacterium camelliae]MDQ1102229.1 DNA-binding NarL/FixJ family response regulator [Chryseobacterium sp. SORGH_AS_1048]MDR6085667.1 DNA-binding NarL/FixJ family response regulator [Chryseobacterium sp. SORGH_AS_0909]MDR6130034.1 DNA-binding NarL/FixJ family response regulator [Chryseoba
MFKKILIAEDQQVMNLGIAKTIQELTIPHFDFVTYCDSAFNKIKKAAAEHMPYDLLITDLSFQKDHIRQNIHSGQELIREARKIQPDLKVIVFSIEHRTKIIYDLYEMYQINGYVSKARNDGKDLKNTITKVFQGERAFPQEILNAMRHVSFDFTDYDLKLLELLSKGWKQNEIEQFFKKNNISPHSRRSIEKRLNDLRESFNAKNNIEMIVICKDIGLI